MNRGQRTLVQPINLIFKHLQQQTKVCIWLFEQTDMKLEGKILGFDEFMNIVLDDAEEVYKDEKKERRSLGRILLKGDNVTLIQAAYASMPDADEPWRHALRSYVRERELTICPTRTGLEALPKLRMDPLTKEMLQCMYVSRKRLPMQAIVAYSSSISSTTLHNTFLLRMVKADVEYLKNTLLNETQDFQIPKDGLPYGAIESSLADLQKDEEQGFTKIKPTGSNALAAVDMTHIDDNPEHATMSLDSSTSQMPSSPCIQRPIAAMSSIDLFMHLRK